MGIFFIGIIYFFIFYGYHKGSEATSLEISKKIYEKSNYVPVENFNFEIFSYNEKTCDLHLNRTIEGYLKKEEWAIQLLDSWGKLPSGLLWGHTTDIGNFDECLSIKNAIPGFNGQYCIGKFNSTLHRQQEVKVGVCIPDSCEPKYFQNLASELAKTLNWTALENIQISNNDCVIDESKQLRIIDMAAFAVYGFFAFLVLISTAYEYIVDLCKKKKHQSCASFSLISNAKKLFSVSNDKEDSSLSENIECLHSIRFLSIIWVVYTYVHASVFLPTTNNPNKFDEWLGNPYSLVIQNSNLAVDSFLLLSGLLVAWAGLKKLDKRGGLKNIPFLYIHRYLRITPILGLTILFAISVSQYFGNGPFWKPITEFTFGNCKKWWWTSLLYVQNYANPNDLCLPNTWPLSIDTQLFLISPLLLVPLLKWGWKFIAVPIILALGSVSASFALFYLRKYHLLSQDDSFQMDNRIRDITIPTHTRAAAWVIGILYGYILHLHRGKELKLPIWTAVINWIISLFVFAVTVFGYFFRLKSYSTPPSLLEGALYESLSRISWAIVLGWVVLACSKGYGGPISDILSLPFWRPFSRLTYCIYILHMVVGTLIYANRKVDIHFSYLDIISDFYSIFGITLVLSVPATLIFESPIRVLDKIIFKRFFDNNEKDEQVVTEEEKQEESQEEIKEGEPYEENPPE